MSTFPLVFTVAEAAHLLGVSSDALYESIAKDTFRSRTGKPSPNDALRWVRAGRRISIPKASIADFLGLTIAECDAYLATGQVPEVQQSRGPQYSARWANWGRQ